jgi:CarD family transcriptional regulator
MQFSVGDKVVHPHHGPGRITGVQQREFLDGEKVYYKIEIPTQALAVYLTSRAMQTLGVRPAIPRARLPRVLDRLQSEPSLLPEDFKVRQEEVWERLKTGRAMQLAETVRDLTWHKERDHLTQKDTDQLAQGKSRLAAEMALVSGTEVSDMERTIEDALAAALAKRAERERRHQLFTQVLGLPSKAN